MIKGDLFMSYPNVLVNFRIPVTLKNEFEDACKRLHMPMTAQANLLMREFVNRQKKARHEPNELNEPFKFYSGIDDAL
jgi:antitoxin component of RelBE/YafQ-DinJ toxin-antitoxin module